jgi:hypothetical protein
MKVLLTQPLSPVSNKIASHKAAQGIIYADQLRNAGYDVTIHMTGKQLYDYNEYDIVALYHGNDWGGSLNLFGGLENYANIEYIIALSNFNGEVWSLAIDMPDYYSMLYPRVDKARKEGKKLNRDWLQINWGNLENIQKQAKTLDPNLARRYDKIAIGDSHAICMYRPEWMNVSTPFKTLHGEIKQGFDTFIQHGEYSEIETYFGNIDIRHHLMRLPNPIESTKELAAKYIAECQRISDMYDAPITMWELLPIENESRVLPKTGYYKGVPFTGTQKERDNLRQIFKEEIMIQDKFPVFLWVDNMINSNGELDFEKMEKPKSVHLSRASYPYWTGADWNAPKPIPGGLESFFS